MLRTDRPSQGDPGFWISPHNASIQGSNIMYQGFERRRSPRRTMLVENRARLECMQIEGERYREARIIDVSDEGMQLELDQPPTLGQLVWLRLHEPLLSSTIGGQVTRCDGVNRIGLKLHTRCPRELTQLATHGLGLGAVRLR